MSTVDLDFGRLKCSNSLSEILRAHGVYFGQWTTVVLLDILHVIRHVDHTFDGVSHTMHTIGRALPVSRGRDPGHRLVPPHDSCHSEAPQTRSSYPYPCTVPAPWSTRPVGTNCKVSARRGDDMIGTTDCNTSENSTVERSVNYPYNPEINEPFMSIQQYLNTTHTSWSMYQSLLVEGEGSLKRRG